jgi:gas vesicle protein
MNSGDEIEVNLKRQVSYCSSKTIVMKDTSKILIALGVGLAVGGVLGVLFAPDKGSVTRHKLADETKKLADTFNRKIEQGKERLQEKFSKINEMEEDLA